MIDRQDDPGRPPDDALDSIALAERHIADVHDYLADRLAFLAMAGAGEADVEELRQISSMLKVLGDSALTGAARIDEADLAIRQEPSDRIGFDEDLAFSLFEEFIDGRTDTAFTTAELRMFLTDQGVHLNSREFNKLFPNWRNEILAERREKGQKVDFEKLEKATYAFVAIRGPEPKSEPISQAVHLTPEAASMATDKATQITLEVLGANLDQAANKNIKEIANLTGISVKDIRLICDTLAGSGVLQKQRRDGYLYFLIAQQDDRPEQNEPTAKEISGVPEVLSDEHEEIIRAMLDALGTLGQYFGRGMFTEQLERYLVSTGMPVEMVNDKVIKRLARQLSKAGVVEAGQAKQRSGGSKFRIRAASAEMNKAIHDAENVDLIIEAVRSQSNFSISGK